MSTTATHLENPPQPLTPAGRGRWPLLGVAAGVGCIVATLGLDIHVPAGDGPATEAVIADLNSGKGHASVIVGYVTVALLLVLAAAWRRHVEPRALASTAARVVPLGFTAAAGALSLGYGWRGALGLYGPGGNEERTFDEAGLYVYYVLNDFSAYIGWLGVTIAAGAIVWMALKERLISRWIGAFAIIPILPVVITVAAFGLPGMPGVTSGLFLIVAFAGLAFGKSPINR